MLPRASRLEVVPTRSTLSQWPCGSGRWLW